VRFDSRDRESLAGRWRYRGFGFVDGLWPKLFIGFVFWFGIWLLFEFRVFGQWILWVLFGSLFLWHWCFVRWLLGRLVEYVVREFVGYVVERLFRRVHGRVPCLQARLFPGRPVLFELRRTA
jgi:hypothetical protein